MTSLLNPVTSIAELFVVLVTICVECLSEENRCFTVYDDKKLSWWKAREHCRRTMELGDLAYFTSPVEQTNVQLEASVEPLWIGLQENGSIWIWTNGEETSYTSFIQESQVSDFNSSDRCAAIVNGSYWQRTSCDEEIGFICVNISKGTFIKSTSWGYALKVNSSTDTETENVYTETTRTNAVYTETTRTNAVHTEESTETISWRRPSTDQMTSDLAIFSSPQVTFQTASSRIVHISGSVFQRKLAAKYKTCKSVMDTVTQNQCLRKLVRDADFVGNIISDQYRHQLYQQTNDSYLHLLSQRTTRFTLLQMYVDLLDVSLDTSLLLSVYQTSTDKFFDFFLNMENLILDIDNGVGSINRGHLEFQRTSLLIQNTDIFATDSNPARQNFTLNVSTKEGPKSLMYVMLMDFDIKTPFNRLEINSLRIVDGSFYVISPLLTVRLYVANTSDTDIHFALEHSHIREKIRSSMNNKTYKDLTHCGFISPLKRMWSTSGCEVIATTDENTVCHCNHTTNFAILMQITEVEIDEIHELALNIITYVGCSVSLLTQIIAVTVFTCVGTLNSERIYIHRNLCLSIMAAQITFLAGIKAVKIKILCSIVAFVLHYFYTSVFVWMLVEGLHLYSKVVQVFGTEKSRLIYYCGFGWGVPLILVTISATADWRGYGTQRSCWLSTKDGTIWAFVGPAVAIIVVNMVILWMVIRIILKLEKTSDYDQIRAGVKGALFLLPLLGLTWIFGLMAVNEDLVVFQYLFALFNSLQGFFIFLFHCVFNTEVRQALQRMRDRQILQRSDLNSNSSGKTRSFSWEEASGGMNRPKRTLYKKDTMSSHLSSSTGGRHSSRSWSSKSSDDIVVEDFSSEEDAITLMYI